ncbi:DUF7674 family protein [Paenibacillus violae]|uniref:DUF7674 domain-containing protein n=1 Tax=Paenibacillus violae TaxID=3077234 RepID=A0ABU3R981_9BACL|nr:hypothetical protein [Paenibacillus sp. PFR10]MDU0200840.1 hypothetical protein [Paenibacillus sp. PFR10]
MVLSENRNIKLLESIFDYFEEVSSCKDNHLINVFSVTVLESLGNDKTFLGVAQEYMGPKTMQLQLEADRGLGRSYLMYQEHGMFCHRKKTSFSWRTERGLLNLAV